MDDWAAELEAAPLSGPSEACGGEFVLDPHPPPPSGSHRTAPPPPPRANTIFQSAGRSAYLPLPHLSPPPPSQGGDLARQVAAVDLQRQSDPVPPRRWPGAQASTQPRFGERQRHLSADNGDGFRALRSKDDRPSDAKAAWLVSWAGVAGGVAGPHHTTRQPSIRNPSSPRGRPPSPSRSTAAKPTILATWTALFCRAQAHPQSHPPQQRRRALQVHSPLGRAPPRRPLAWSPVRQHPLGRRPGLPPSLSRTSPAGARRRPALGILIWGKGTAPPQRYGIPVSTELERDLPRGADLTSRPSAPPRVRNLFLLCQRTPPPVRRPGLRIPPRPSPLGSAKQSAPWRGARRHRGELFPSSCSAKDKTKCLFFSPREILLKRPRREKRRKKGGTSLQDEGEDRGAWDSRWGSGGHNEDGITIHEHGDHSASCRLQTFLGPG